MPSLLSTVYYTVRIWKRAIGNPSFEWANSYEVVLAGEPADYATLDTMIADMGVAESAIFNANVEMVRAEIASWVDDSTHPYDPSAFLVHEYVAGLLGGRSIGTSPLARHVVLNVRRSVPYGRSGKLAYRGVLAEGDITGTTSLEWQLESGSISDLQDILDTMYAAMQTAIVAAGGVNSTLSLVRGTGETIDENRPVLAFVVRDVDVNSPDHKYFDRA